MNKDLDLKFSSLPEELKAQVSDFIDFVVARYKKKKKKESPRNKPKFGSAKGMFKMSPDFDEPLEYLKDYM